MRKITAFLLIPFLLIQAGCLLEGSSVTGSENEGGEGGTFAASDLNATWTMGTCTAGSSGLAGTTHFQASMTLFNSGDFNYSQYWYSSGACSGGALAQYSVGGTFTVGQPISSSSSLQTMNFVANYSGLAVYTAGLVTYVNGNCAGGGWVLNTSKSTYMTTCSFLTTPNSGNKNIQNVGSLSGKTLSLGTSYNGIPGVFGTTSATSSSQNFTKP